MGSEYTRTGAFRATGPTSVQLDIPIVPDKERLGFNVRKFATRWNLDGAKGGGAHMWREVWDDDVSLIYRDILSKFLPLSRMALVSYFFSSYGGTYLWPPTQSGYICAGQAAKEIYIIDHSS
jgi:hypothetical protein